LPWLVSAVLLAAALPLFLRLGFHSEADFKLHAEQIGEFLRAGLVPVHFVYHYGVAAMTGFSTDLTRLIRASAVFVSLAVALKYLVSMGAAASWLDLLPRRDARDYQQLMGAGVGLLFVFCLPLPGQNWYLGQFPPNVWHNSTTLAVMPVAVLVFFYSAAYLESGEPRLLRVIVPLVLLANLTKPSLFFSYAVAFPLIALLRFGLRRPFVLSLLPVLAGGALVVAFVAQLFFDPGHARISDDTEATLALGWFFPWKVWSSNIPLSLLNSLLLPLLFLLAYPRRCLGDLRIRFAVTMLIVGLPIFAFVHETGVRALHGNLSWQNIIVNYLLHLSMLVAFLALKRETPAYSWRDRVLVAAFVAEALVGAVYVGRFVAGGSYL